MTKTIAFVALTVFLALCNPAFATTPDPSTAALCEAQGMVAYGTAREAIVTGRKKAYWRWQVETSDYQNSFLDALYARIDGEAFKDYLLFGAEKYFACLQGAGFAQSIQPEAATRCFAQIDVALYAQKYKAGGGGLAGTRKYARNYLKDVATYPQPMLDEIIPLAFKAANAQEFGDVRAEILHRCISSVG